MRESIRACFRENGPYLNVIRKEKEAAIPRLYQEMIGEGELALNIGSASVSYGKNCINMDIRAFRNIQVLGDAHELPFASGTFRLCILSAVLQYCSHPEKVVREVYRILAPGGIAVIDVPFMQPVCGPHDLHRFSHDGLIGLFEKMEILRCETSIPFGSAMAFYVQTLVMSSVANPYLRVALANLASVFLLPLSFLRITRKKSYAGALLLVARKPHDPAGCEDERRSPCCRS